MSVPQQQIPTVSQILQAYASPVLRRRAMMAMLRALNSDQSGGA